MAGLPANVNFGTVTGRLITAEQIDTAEPDGLPISGKVTFRPTPPLIIDAAADTLIVPKSIQVNLDVTGAFSTQLVATDDADLNPSGWTYEVSFQLNGGVSIPSFHITVPTGSTRDLADIAPVPGAGGVYYVPGGSDADVAARISGGAATQAAGDARWQRNLQILNVKNFGAVGSGAVDDTGFIQAAFDAVPATGGVVYFPPGTYLARLLRPKSNTKILGTKGSTLVYRGTGAAAYDALIAFGDSAAVGGITTASNLKNIHIEGLTFRGNGDSSGLSENQALLHLSGVSDVTVVDCQFVGMQGDGIYIGCTSTAATERHNERITVRDCIFDGLNKFGRQGVSIIEGTDVLIEGCRFQNTTAPTMPGAVDIETNPLNTWALIRNITVSRCTFRNIGGNVGHVSLAMPAVVMANPVKNIVFENNHHDSTGRPYFVGGANGVGVSTEPSGVDIRGNYARCASGNSQAVQVQKLRGVRISGNEFVAYTLSPFLLAADVVDIEIKRNTLVECGTSSWSGVECIGTVANLDVSENRIVTNVGHVMDQLILASNAAVTGVRAVGNSAVGVTNLMALSGTGSTDGSLNYAYSNMGFAVPSSFFITSSSALIPGAFKRVKPTPSGASNGLFALAKDPNNANRLWVQGQDFGQLGYTDDGGATWVPKVDLGALVGAVGIHQLSFADGYAYLLVGNNASKNGQLWRSPAPDANGNGLNFVKKFDLAAPPGGIITGTNSCFRPNCFAVIGAICYLLEYSINPSVTGGPSIYGSGDRGETWAKTYTWANAKHGHAVAIAGSVPVVTLGDSGVGWTDIGFQRASTVNADVWTQVSSFGEAIGGNTNYGIKPIPATIAGKVCWLLEYDGGRNFGPLVYPDNVAGVATKWPLEPLCKLPYGYFGTNRSIIILSNGNLMFANIAENGAFGAVDSFWVLKGPNYDGDPVLLDTVPTGTMPWADAIQIGNDVWMGWWKMTIPRFIGQ